MKSTVNTTTTFKYILLFTFLFAAFLALAITYNKVYRLKNETVSIIEKYEGVINNKKAIEVINNYLRNSGYNTLGQCDPTSDYGVKDLNINNYEKVNNNSDKYYYCLSNKIVKNDNKDKIYYNVTLFFKFNLPFLGELFTFKITGETKGVQLHRNSGQVLTG